MQNRYTCIVLALLLLAVAPVKADFAFEFGLNNGRSGNMLEDSSVTDAAYTSLSGSARWYPDQSIEMRWTEEYTRYYNNLDGLSNLRSTLGLSVVPTRSTSKFRLYISGNFNGRIYKDDFRDFSSTNDFDLIGSASYKLALNSQIRTGAKATYKVYTNAEIDDITTWEAFIGFNQTLPQRTAFDIELGYSTGSYQYVNSWDEEHNRPTGAITSERSYSILDDGDMKIWYISPRISKQLGNKLGLSATYSHREIIDRNDSALVYGYSTSLLSPANKTYEGDGITIRAKSYHIPKSVLEMGFGYWEKDFLKTIETTHDVFQGAEIITTLFAKDRSDKRRRIYAEYTRPLSLGGYFLEPKLRIESIHNSSTLVVYDYDYFDLSLALTLKF
ncbi:MAG TPA: hypothetical protein PLF13_05475 [candidate division Zixibacteria bacterium]|nr:hypothetical protein [candidate division Zixibacteria bacterium]